MNSALELPSLVLVVSHGGVYWGINELLKLPALDLPNGIPIFYKPPKTPKTPWIACPIEES